MELYFQLLRYYLARYDGFISVSPPKIDPGSSFLSEAFLPSSQVLSLFEDLVIFRFAYTPTYRPISSFKVRIGNFANFYTLRPQSLLEI